MNEQRGILRITLLLLGILVAAMPAWGGRAPGVAAGDEHAVAVATDGSVWSWGRNDGGQLGDGTTTLQSTPVAVAVPGGARTVAAGVDFTLALALDGTVWAWGANDSGQLGNGTTTDSAVPVPVQGLSDIVAVTAGDYHGVALGADGTVWTWGDNRAGQLADGTITNHSLPRAVAGIANVTAIDAGGYFTLALRADGTVWGWGQNNFGQLGDGTTIERHAPVAVGIDQVTALAAGFRHALALRSDQTLWAWGFNDSGQLGDGLSIDPNAFVTLPQAVAGLGGAVRIAAGAYHSLAALGDGTVLGWGWNLNGQLGNGTTADSSSPVTVTGVTSPLALAAGLYHSLVLAGDGTLQSWGGNSNGQLGTGTTSDSQVPVAVSLPASLFNGPYSVTPALNGDGSLAPATVQTAARGTTVSFELTPAALYALAAVSGCDGTLSGSTYTTAAIYADCTVTATFAPIDSDGDGVVDLADNCPALANADQADLDHDGLGNLCDDDADGDGVLNAADAFPLDAGETLDTDHDGSGNNADSDDDGDGWSDSDETACASDALLATSVPLDTDGDHLCNALDPDIDGDGVANGSDAFPLDASEWRDSDHDGLGDNADSDDDGDGIPDLTELANGTDPLNPDITPPGLSVDQVDAQTVASVSFTLSGTATDETQLSQVTLNGQALTLSNGLFSQPVALNEGANTLTLVAVDAAGNRTTVTRTVTLDTTAPPVTIATPSDHSFTATPQATITGSCGDAVAVSVRINSAAPQAATLGSGGYALDLTLPEGQNTLTVTAVDHLGNSASISHVVTYDATAPALSLNAPASDVTVSALPLTISGTVSDALTSVVSLTMTVNNAAVTPGISGGDFSYPLVATVGGNYQIVIVATDQLGNSATVIRNITYQPYGDVDGNQTVDIADALAILRMSVGLVAASPLADVAPLVNHQPHPDGKVSAVDALAVLRKILQLESW